MDDEPLFKKDNNRKSILPIKYADLWGLYKRAEASFWTLEEIDFSSDRHDFENNMTADERSFIELILAFFAGADAIVNCNIAENLLQKVDIQEVKCFYGFQIMIENVHNEVYSQLIDTLIRDPLRKLQLLNSIENIPAIKRLYDWAETWIARTPEIEFKTNRELQRMEDVVEARRLAKVWCLAKQIVAFACIEGIQFSGPFAAIYWLKEKGILKGTTFSNEKISADEGMHRDFACLLFKKYVNNKPPDYQIYEIIFQAVEFEKEFMNTALDRLLGMNKNSMCEYIEFVADHLAVSLGYKKIYKTVNPFHFMDKISINGFTNFFERKVAEYSMSGFEDTDNTGMEELEDF